LHNTSYLRSACGKNLRPGFVACRVIAFCIAYMVFISPAPACEADLKEKGLNRECDRTLSKTAVPSIPHTFTVHPGNDSRNQAAIKKDKEMSR